MNNINNENIPFNQAQGSHFSSPEKKPSKIPQPLNSIAPNASPKKIQKASIETSKKRDEFYLLRSFVQFLSLNLDPDLYKKQINQLWDIGIDKKIFECIDLLKVKSCLSTIRDQILLILKDIKSDDLDNLNALTVDMELPTDFDNILDLAVLLQAKGSKIRTVHKLLDYGEVDMALFITSKLTSEDKRKEALSEIAEDYEKQVDPDKIPENIRFDLLTQIFKHVVKEKKEDHILDFGAKILNDYSSHSLKQSKAFYSALSKLDADLFVKLADTLTLEKREIFLEKFFMYLQKRDEVNHATEIAKKTNSESILNGVLED